MTSEIFFPAKQKLLHFLLLSAQDVLAGLALFSVTKCWNKIWQISPKVAKK